MAASIRRATRADIAALVALERDFPSDRLSRHQFHHLLTQAHADVLAGVQQGRVVGNVVVLYRRGSKAARVYSLVVDPAKRGQGLASALLKAAERAARRKGCDRVQLEVRPDNNAALRLYQKFGYEITRRILGFYEDGTDALRLEHVFHSASVRRR